MFPAIPKYELILEKILAPNITNDMMRPAMVGRRKPMNTPKLPCSPLASMASPAAASDAFWDSDVTAAYLSLSSSMGRDVFVETKIVVAMRKTIRASKA